MVALCFCATLVGAAARPAVAAERSDNVTITMAGRFASHITTQGAPAPSRASTQRSDAAIDLHGNTLIYTADGQSQSTRFDRSAGVITAAARCRDEPAGGERRTTLKAGTTGGLLVVMRYREISFPSASPCAGADETVNELIAVTLAKGRCSFQYTVSHKRNGPDSIDTKVEIAGAPCRAISSPAPRAPAVARGPGEARPVAPATQNSVPAGNADAAADRARSDALTPEQREQARSLFEHAFELLQSGDDPAARLAFGVTRQRSEGERSASPGQRDRASLR
jgi:hypothetical protein